MSTLTSILRWCALVLLLLATCLAIAGPPAARADGGPCSEVSGDPGDPGPGSEPDIAGTVTDTDTMDPVSGATMQLYVCSQGSAAYVTSVATNGSGHYEFWYLAEGFYYVQATMTGPLYGMSPSGDTTNPSDIVAVGAGDRGLDFSFQ